MTNIWIIGAGQLGSRHLQALKGLDQPISITVIDRSPQSLQTAEERYNSISGVCNHSVSYVEKIPADNSSVELAIVATNSDVRKLVVQELLENNSVKNMILEKLLFNRREDYITAQKLIRNTGTQVWVNCSMRTMPFYHSIKELFFGQRIFYHVSGGQFGLVTNAIHYLDHMAYLLDCNKYIINPSQLDTQPIASKRPGFMELNGTLQATFTDGSQGMFTCYPQGNAPIMVQIMSETHRLIVRESEGKAWLASSEDGWRWIEVEATIPFQSQMTTKVADGILLEGKCDLVEYEESMFTHLTLLDSLLQFLNKGNQQYDYYPFT